METERKGDGHRLFRGQKNNMDLRRVFLQRRLDCFLPRVRGGHFHLGGLCETVPAVLQVEFRASDKGMLMLSADYFSPKGSKLSSPGLSESDHFNAFISRGAEMIIRAECSSHGHMSCVDGVGATLGRPDELGQLRLRDHRTQGNIIRSIREGQRSDYQESD